MNFLHIFSIIKYFIIIKSHLFAGSEMQATLLLKKRKEGEKDKKRKKKEEGKIDKREGGRENRKINQSLL